MASADPNASRLAGWRVALRIARRDALRSRGRSALVVVMIGLPVMLSTAIAVLVSTQSLNAVEQLPRRLGTAQAELTPQGRQPVVQDAQGQNVMAADDTPPPPGEEKPWTADELGRLAGGRVYELGQGATTVAVPTGRASVAVLTTDAPLALLRGRVDLLEGRPAESQDEVLVDARLQARGFDIGDPITLGPDGARGTVVGVVRVVDPYSGGQATALVQPGLLPRDLGGGGQFLLSRPTPVGWDEVLRLNKAGVSVFSRAVVTDPPSAEQLDPRLAQVGGGNDQQRSVVIIIVTSVMLEVVLLAGPAFAVGVRRQQRQLALLAATGANRSHVRRTVLAGGAVLGLGASLAGAALGLLLAVAVVLAANRWRYGLFGPFEVPWPAVAAAVALGTVAALAAAAVPARQASKLDVVAALTGRRAEARASRGAPLVGLVLAGVGAAITLVLGTRPSGELMVATGTIVAVVGLVALMPLLVGLVGRGARRLPVPLRIAARDGARHRTRTAPAVAAVMGVVAGMTALAIGGASDQVERRASYTPELAMGASRLSFTTGAQVDQLTAAAQRVVPGSRWLPVGTVGSAPPNTADTPRSVALLPTGCTAKQVASPAVEADQSCSSWQLARKFTTPTPATGVVPVSYGLSNGEIAPVEALPVLRYSLTATQQDVLRRGGLLVSNPETVRPDGTARVLTYGYDGSAATDLKERSVPAAYLAPQQRVEELFGFGLIATPETAKALGLPWSPDRAVLASGQRLTQQQESDLGDAVRVVDDSAGAYTERGFRDELQIPFLILAVAAAIAVLVGTLTATGLALADARPDLATLAAIGASPRSRRVMAGAHALVIGLLGTLTGTVLGFLPGIAVTYPLTSFQGRGPYLDVPWTMLLTVALVVPLLAAAVAAVAHRTRQPLTRRV